MGNLATPAQPPTKDMFPMTFRYRPPPVTDIFPDAIRIPPLFNQVIMFLPHYGSGHAVELVESPNDKQHRFSFTSWRQVDDFDSQKHYSALGRRFERMKAQRAEHSTMKTKT